MALDRLTTVPIAFTSGSNLRVDYNIDGLPASDGGSIVLFLRGLGEIEPGDITYSTDGDNFTIDATAAATAEWDPGIYEYTVRHTDSGGIKDIIETGRIEILANPDNESRKDARTYTEIFLERLYETAKELARNPYKTIQVGDQIYVGHDMEKLQTLIETYEKRLFGEKNSGSSDQFDVSIKFTD